MVLGGAGIKGGKVIGATSTNPGMGFAIPVNTARIIADQIGTALERAELDPEIRVVILTGSGTAFMETISPEGFDFFTPQGYDKIYREDVLAHAYALCRSNRGAPGVDRQDFADVEEYGLKQWLGELALALKDETYRPAPIRRVYIPKANGKLRPLGISTRASYCTLLSSG